MSTIADRLVEARTMSGLSPGQVCRILPFDRRRLGRIESGAANPEQDEIARLADLYDVRLDWLADGVDIIVDPAPFIGMGYSDAAKVMRLLNIVRP